MAAVGERSAAVDTLRPGAQRDAEIGLLIDEALLRHDVVVVGDARAERNRLVTLAQLIGGKLTAAFVDHADALLAGSGQLLEGAARRFADLGVDLVAAEVAFDARDAYRREGLRGRPAAFDELAGSLIERCEGMRSSARRRPRGSPC